MLETTGRNVSHMSLTKSVLNKRLGVTFVLNTVTKTDFSGIILVGIVVSRSKWERIQSFDCRLTSIRLNNGLMRLMSLFYGCFQLKLFVLSLVHVSFQPTDAENIT